MNYAQVIYDTLSPLGLPVKETKYTGAEPVYIVFTCYNEQAAATAANEPIEREYDFMLNLYQQASNASADLNLIKEQVISLLEKAGFCNVIARNRNDLETEYNRWLFDCSYTENLQETP
jgi:hypothetical protein